jgi:hypothetical protein
MELQIRYTYYDSELGKLLYIGRIGYELNLPMISKQKGKNVFIAVDAFKLPVFVTLNKDDINNLKKITLNGNKVIIEK